MASRADRGQAGGSVWKERRRQIRKVLKFGASLLGAAIVALAGWWVTSASLAAGGETRARPRLWLLVSFAESLTRLSYDLLFAFRGTLDAPGVCIVYLDEHAARALGQTGGVWDRRLHAQLVRRLTADGARAVLFDLVFGDASPDPAVDQDFAAAIQENGHVFLGAALELDSGLGADQERTVAPIPVLRRAAAGWGLLAFRPIDADYGVRRIYTGVENVPSATWRAAVKLGAALPDTLQARAESRWLNYYGPPSSLANLGYDRALAPDEVPPGFFRDRIVVVGGRPTLGTLQLGKDEFRTPYALLGRDFSSGVEIHLTTLLNLLHGEWLVRLDGRRELWIVLATGLLLGGVLPRFRPHLAALLAGLGLLLVVGFACWLVAQHRIWFAWCVPALVQTPLALAWAVGARYFLEERRRHALREAFGHYLSPHMADRIADAEFDLAPGGVVIEATVLVTDLEGFAALAEELHNPELVSHVLTRYFTQTTGHILDSDGTIINFVGDSVLAVWGAPLADPDHARKAVLAAWRLHVSSLIEIDGRALRTRVGVHTGQVLAGNIGSIQRFDYAVVGDTVNFASRLEGLNKHLGTNILISDVLRQQLGDTFLSRCLGEFRVVGKKEGHVVHELLGPTEATPRPPWLDGFAQGLEAFRRGDLEIAERQMRETLARTEGADGVANFYLQQIATLRATGCPPDWQGVVEFTIK
ncbi:MAG: adenylate cyclase [Chthoniobacter sp.]|jgi:adenylate cyclase|nr:adenylate cyclase [Chthoniobacter sp.]